MERPAAPPAIATTMGLALLSAPAGRARLTVESSADSFRVPESAASQELEGFVNP